MEKMISDAASVGEESAGKGAPRTSSLDVTKCFAAFFVVCIHYGADWLSPVVRCAVPMFFVITGYYYPMMVAKGTLWKHVRKLLVMAICSSALYALWGLQYNIGRDNLDRWAGKTFTVDRLIDWIALNADMVSPHLWYFYAALYSLIVLHFADKWRLTKWLRYAVPILLAVHFFRNFTPWPNVWVRNFLFMGLPLMMTGRCIRENRDRTFRFLSNRRYLWAYVFGSLLVSCGEMFLLGIASSEASDVGKREMYVFTLPIVLSCFYWALRHPQFGEGTLLAAIGRKYSVYIYIFHVLAGIWLSDIINRKDSLLAETLFPFLVFAVSLCMAWLFAKLLQWRKKHCSKHS